MSGLLRLENVTAGYGGKPVVRDVNITIERGELCTLLGLNGSGKTTLLKAVSGLLTLDSGRCFVGEMDCTGFHEHRRARFISHIPQRHSKMQGVPVLDVVLMGRNPHLGLLDSPTKKDLEQATETIEKMGLIELIDEDFAQLSEGQKQMVILVRTLVQDTPAMLMDEPDSALDFLNRHRMLAKIRDLIHSQGKAGLITLHDPNFALAYCDRLILLQDGSVIGELKMKTATKDSIHGCLALIYGNIEILEHGGRYMMLQGSG
ncbi:MAG: ABC transporter ATP-binding protein [Synergistaceae bacterium]|nr:ABC transporter ATP-binding protein [Synergistaceae bacterium]